MINTILALKQKSSQTFVGDDRVPVTKIIAGPVVVTQIKSMDTDKYWSVQLGFSNRPIKNTSKPLRGHLSKIKSQISDSNLKSTLPRYLREVRLEKEIENLEVGTVIKVEEVLKVGDTVSVMGVSKGKGFASGIKRYGFRGGPRTHGQSDRERAPGSIGQTTTPGRVYKGKKMAGNMGRDQVTVKNLKVIAINPETQEIEISGQVPGTVGTLLTITKLNA